MLCDLSRDGIEREVDNLERDWRERELDSDRERAAGWWDPDLVSREVKNCIQGIFECGGRAKELCLSDDEKERDTLISDFKNQLTSPSPRSLCFSLSGSHVVIIGQRKILGAAYKRDQKSGNKGPRPRSRTLTHVKEAV